MSIVLKKIVRRSVFAFGVLLACGIGLWATGFTLMGWVVTGLAFGVGAVSVVLGVVNPFNSARVEEFLVCQVLTLFVPFWPWIR